ncbi:MAG TPA: histidine--tRNA ligase, partial [Candidatus Acidoferrales bacterium]|nr:histidine--tRNA ligase [Candidatus Acidoferrales bacterium]
MAEKRQFRAIKGTRDILPPDSALWNWFEQTARETFESYNFGEIRLPIFEETELFARSIGTETDVVGKEMYTFEDHNLIELSQQRSALVLSRPPIDRLEDLGRFEQSVQRFLGAVTEHLSKGNIPRTQGNVKAVDDTKFCLKAMASAQVAWLERQSSTRQTEFDEHSNGIASALGSIRFGVMITLRPEATASVCRAYIERGMHTRPGNVKLYYVGPMFRRERPQKGRYRQFYQIGAEVLGQSDAPAIDAELIEMLLTFFRRVSLTSTTLYINSIGDKNCRPQYVEQLRKELQKVKDQLGPDSQRRIETNPLRVLDSKLEQDQPVIASLAEKKLRITDHLCDECREHFAKLKDELKQRGIQYEENWRLVRGLDYYTRTTFEVTAAGLGSQNAVCGGGRYDGLVELLGGPPTKGIGFAIGSDRAILSIQENAPDAVKRHVPSLGVFIAWMGAAAHPTAVNIAKKLRDRGVSVELPTEEMKFKKSLGLADKLGARYALIIGEDEVASGQYSLKNLADGKQEKLGESALLEY